MFFVLKAILTFECLKGFVLYFVSGGPEYFFILLDGFFFMLCL